MAAISVSRRHLPQARNPLHLRSSSSPRPAGGSGRPQTGPATGAFDENPLAALRNPRLFLRVSRSSALPGLTASLDKLRYHHGGASLPPDKPHAFVYFITIRNGSDRSLTLLGRKWMVRHADGTSLVIEGDQIVGDTPCLAPGESFSYSSYHVTGLDACAHGSFHGVDEFGNLIHVVMPPFDLTIPRH